MKIRIIITVGSFAAVAAMFAQEPVPATAADGRRVLLYPDGTWRLSKADAADSDSEPPKETLKDAASHFANGPVTDYKVTNHYTRQLKDETFHVYEMTVTYIWRWEGKPDKSLTNEATIGFVKRGNGWYFRRWDARE